MNIHRKFIITLSLIAFLLILFSFGIYFLSGNIKEKKDLISETQKQLSFVENRIENAKELEAVLAGAEEKHNSLKPALISKNDIVVFIKDIENLAEGTNVEMEIKSANVLRDQNKMIFNLDINGSFGDIYHYLLLLENSDYCLKINNARIDAGKEGQVWLAKIELELLSFEND